MSGSTDDTGEEGVCGFDWCVVVGTSPSPSSSSAGGKSRMSMDEMLSFPAWLKRRALDPEPERFRLDGVFGFEAVKARERAGEWERGRL